MRGAVVPTVVTVSREQLDAETGAITADQPRRRADTMLAEIAAGVAMRRAHAALVAVAV
jgi:hypothetical protein